MFTLYIIICIFLVNMIIKKLTKICKKSNGGKRMKIKQTAMALALVASVMAPGAVNANSNVSINVNGNGVYAPMAYISAEDRTMVPIAIISEAMGYQVSWEPGLREARFSGENGVVTAKIGEPKINVNGAEMRIDSPAVIKEDRTMVPLSAISTALGADVKWDAATRLVNVSSKQVVVTSLESEVKAVKGFENSKVVEFETLDAMLDDSAVETILKDFVQKNTPLKVTFVSNGKAETFDNVLEVDLFSKDANIIILHSDATKVFAVKVK